MYYLHIYKHILGHNIDIFNLSVEEGGSKIVEDAVAGGVYGSRNVRQNLSKTIDVLAQKNAKEKTIIVWAASNDNGDKNGQLGSHTIIIEGTGMS